MEYSFTLTYRLPDDAADVDETVERLGEAGCNDALIGLGQSGRIALAFDREANSAREAMVSALGDVKRAIPAASLIEASPDLVGLSDVAEIVGVSRQNMRKLMMNSASFPSPIHAGSTVIWHLAHILAWLDAKGCYEFDTKILEVAGSAMLINFAKESRQHGANIPSDISEVTA
ncbi:DNA-binding protein [Massilia eurypsychrophila]|uniref:DNA-binding protein n=1 Tax=Massilia eurypsychrophila TaxID=1485217 RepID=A0A2G8TM41_9BURK|nr:DNA-binding protein [Massilia eurypsychrophila]PIL47059.1 DNA-binding protein [Massilia eurypsychrophila]